MANIVVTSDKFNIKVDFGAYGGSNNLPLKRVYDKSKSIVFFSLLSDRVTALAEGEYEWQLAYTATTGCFIVDSVDGVTPSSNSNLYDLLVKVISPSTIPLASATVTCNSTTTALVSANGERKGLVITNTGSNAIFLGLDESAVLNKGIYLAASGGTWVMDEYTFTKGAINGITVSSTSNISIQEFE